VRGRSLRRRQSDRFDMRSARVAQASQLAGLPDTSKSASEMQAEENTSSADPSIGSRCSASDPVEEAHEAHNSNLKPLRRKGPKYSWTLWDHCALLTSSAFLMVGADSCPLASVVVGCFELLMS
jgi:hypothetical protein